ncbi:MAG: hypothetical protein IH987_16090, partial [Planctomycetes bacterium]|nr:hypothetical protein [Planctomycetota bacterium]
GAFLFGLTMGALLMGLAAVVKYSHAVNRSADESDGPTPYYSDAAEAEGGGAESSLGLSRGDSRQLVTTITDLRDVQLLPKEAREENVARLRIQAQRRATEEIIDAINRRELGRARILLRDVEAVYGSTQTLERLGGKIEEASTRHESLDFARSKRVVEAAIREGEWGQAESYAHTLYTDHPDSARSKQLWEDTRRARLNAHIQESVQHHHWAEALAATEEFLERFPVGREAEALRSQKATLATNAEIVQRKQYEEKFKELIGGHHFADALRIARHVIEHFPRSPQAQALREQIPILEQRVAGQTG